MPDVWDNGEMTASLERLTGDSDSSRGDGTSKSGDSMGDS